MKISFKAIGRNIRTARKAAGLTQQEAAECLGISTLHYGRLERGERPLSLAQAADIAVLLHIPLLNLFDGMINEMMIPSPSANRKGIGFVIDFLAAGCSDEARSLMTDLCTRVAQQENIP